MGDKRSPGEIQVAVGASMIADSQTGQEVAIATLQKLLANVQRSPAEPKYRTIKLTNPKIQERLCTCSGAVHLLTACGFCDTNRVLTLAGEPNLALLALAQLRLAGIAADAVEQQAAEKAEALGTHAAERAAEKEEKEALRRACSGDKKERKQEGWTASTAEKGKGQMKGFGDVGVDLDAGGG